MKMRQEDKQDTLNRDRRRWFKSLQNRRGSGMMIVGIIMSLTVLALISIIWITLHEPIAAIIDSSKVLINDTAWNATLTTTRFQFDLIPWFAVILFIISIFMGAYVYSKVDRPVREGYYG